MSLAQKVDKKSPAWIALSAIASLHVTVVGLIFLLILTIWGTVFQVEHGLYQAQQQFYGSWFFLGGGWLPFPGAKTVMGVLLVNLIASGSQRLFLGVQRTGLFFTHAGLIIMLGAGAIIFYCGQESHLTLIEGESTNVTEAAHDWELAVWPDDTGTTRNVSAINLKGMTPTMSLPVPNAKFDIVVEQYLPNADAFPARRDGQPSPYHNGFGVAEVAPKELQKEPEAHRPALAFAIRQSGKESHRVLLWGGDQAETWLDIGGTKYIFGLRRTRFPMPAIIELLAFKKEMHPGIDMARSFSSRVRVRPEEGIERDVTISMNKPLRFAGLTFYQSSYNILPDGRQASTFAVVKNYGRTMPYIATGVTFAGMVIHFVGLLVVRVQKSRKQGATP